MGTDLLELTARLVDIPSESFSEGPITDLLHEELTAVPWLAVTRVGDNLVARTELGRSTRLVLAGHTDTVPANGNERARIDGDVLWGVGSTDMKGGIATMLELARTVASPLVDVTYVFYAREEVAHEHSGLGELVEQRPDLLEGDAALLGEPTDGRLEAGCQGTLRVRLSLAGERAHTARPWMGRNAIHRLAPLLDLAATYEPRQPVIDGCRYHESLQVVGVEGGVAGNVVPDEATLVVSYRFAPDRDEAQAEAHLQALVAPLLDPGDGFVVETSSPAAAPGLGHPLIQSLVERNRLEVVAKLGWTDVARFAGMGMPAANFGPGDATIAHSADERLHRGNLDRTYAALEDLITNGT